jgi:uncharacterized YigZ family protein
MPKPYLIPAACAEYEYEIKKSRFIALASHCDSLIQAKITINAIKKQYGDARHWCYAYNTSLPHTSQFLGCSDDGEPSGTAGQPMLKVVSNADIGEILIVVVRYFGGIKLGTGGLARAYTQATSEVIKLLECKTITPTQQWRVTCDYALEPTLRQILSKSASSLDSLEYTHQINALISIPIIKSEEVKLQLQNASKGQATMLIVD